jgi:hypothetical protein
MTLGKLYHGPVAAPRRIGTAVDDDEKLPRLHETPPRPVTTTTQ